MAPYVEEPCAKGSCGAGRVCLQHYGGSASGDGGLNTFYCVAIPCDCDATPTCECITNNLGLCQSCATPGDAEGTNIVASGDLLCLGE